jgi:hypothetical protein
MLKPNQNFKLDKQVKRFMATIVDDQERGAYKRAMIQAQLEAERIVVSKKQRKPE